MSESECHSFTAPGMNTTFWVRVRHSEADHAHRAAGACFNLLELIESDLSRYRPDSDISRINKMETGSELFISPRTHACLKLATEAFLMTGGLFDVTLGSAITDLKEDRKSEAAEPVGRIEIAPDRALVKCIEAGRELDLGGIGKGFALELMAELLAEHSVDSALVSAGASTHRTIGPDPWRIELVSPSGSKYVGLTEGALSASGTEIQGVHVVRPEDDGSFQPSFERVWLSHANAAFADAFSTACMLMTADELNEFVDSRPDILSLAAEKSATGEVVSLRPFQELL